MENFERARWSNYIHASAKYMHGIVGAIYNPALKYGVAHAKHLSTSTQAAIVTSSGKWLLRLDRPHGKVNFPHININPFLTKVRDPHVPIPQTLVTIGSGANRIIRSISDVALYASFAIDSYRIYTAKRGEKVKVVSSTAGGYAGALVLASATSIVGGWIGGGIGFLVGGAFAVPCYAFGSMIGGVVGGVKGSMIGNKIGEDIASEYYLYSK